MSTTRKVLTIIFSILIIAAFAFVLTWGIINWSKVKDGMAGNGLYTQDDVQNAYEDGYSTALTDKEEYDKLINSYRDTITTQNDLISQYTSEATALNGTIKDYQGQVATLNEQKTALETQIETLNTVKASNEATISELNGQIAALSNQVLTLQANKDENARQITALTEQITNLQNLNAQLQENNELNLQTITGLNGQIYSLNEQIEHLQSQIQTELSAVTQLNDKIAELQNSVAYYEQYIAKFETDNKVTVTFEFAGSVYNLQLVEKGSKVTVEDPTSTEYLIFNGWTVDNNPIDLSTFVVNEKVTIVADVTYRYAVKFVVDGEVKSSQIIEQGQYVEEPAKPRKTGYTFEYWTYGETQVYFDQFPITQNITFVAKFSRLYDVSFVYEELTLTTRRVKENTTTTPYAVTSTEYKVFNGWQVNGAIVDVATYKIMADTVFVADITYKYEVRFISDDNVHNIQMVEKNAKPTLPSTPTKTNYVFVGWSIDGTNAINVSEYTVTENVTFTAIFRVDKFTVTFKNGNTTVETQEVQNGGYASKPAFDTETFLGWTTDGKTVINLSTYKITANTTFTAKYGTWTAVGNNAYYAYGDGYSGNSTTVRIDGLKAGDKVKIDINFMQANIADTGSNSYWYNSSDGNGCYGWQYYGEWIAMDEYGNLTGAFDFGDTLTLKSTETHTSTLGLADYGTENTFTIKISCKKDNELTIEWSDNAGFYIETMTFWDVYVLR